MRRPLGIAIPVAVVLSAAIAVRQELGSDYGNLDCHLRDEHCDDAQPALEALARGDFDLFFAKQPLMGPLTLFLRAPFVAVTRIGEYDVTTAYRAGVFACLLVLAACAIHVAASMRAEGRPLWQQVLVGVGFLVNPLVFRVLDVGHPEELVTTAACISAVLALRAGHTSAAGLLIGAALASKLWAILIVPAIALAVVDRRTLVRMAALAGAVVLLSYAPGVIGGHERLRESFEATNKLGTLPGSVTPANVWWFFASEKATFDRTVAVQDGNLIQRRETGFRLTEDVAPITHPLVVILAALFALLWARRVAPVRPDTLLLLFALIFLMRCLLDPGNSAYYHFPAVAALLAYEGVCRRGFPWATLWLVGCIVATHELAPHVRSDVGFGLIYMGWAVPTFVGLWLWLFARRFNAGTAATEPPVSGGAPAGVPSTAT